MNIQSHIFFDQDIEEVIWCESAGTVDIYLDEKESVLFINKSDAEALAKHFGLIDGETS